MDSFIVQIVTEDTEDYEGERFDSWNNKIERTLSIGKHKIILAIMKNKFSREILNEFAV